MRSGFQDVTSSDTFRRRALFFIAMFTVPSLPRYQFERDAMSKIEGKEWLRVVNKSYWGDATEPLTWIKTPVGSVTIVMPDLVTEASFKEVTMRYGEATGLSLVEPDCTDLTILYARSDEKGTFRYTSGSPTKMSPEQKKWYCEYDWSKEKEALRTEYLRQKNEAPRK